MYPLGYILYPPMVHYLMVHYGTHEDLDSETGMCTTFNGMVHMVHTELVHKAMVHILFRASSAGISQRDRSGRSWEL